MSALATRFEQAGRSLTAEEVFELTRAREKSLSHLLILYISTGLAFMLLPGAFLGVWNLLAISTITRRLRFPQAGSRRTDTRRSSAGLVP